MVKNSVLNACLYFFFFQKFDILPVVVRVDYSPSRVDLAALRGGKYVELVNLVPWKVTPPLAQHTCTHIDDLFLFASLGCQIICIGSFFL